MEVPKIDNLKGGKKRGKTGKRKSTKKQSKKNVKKITTSELTAYCMKCKTKKSIAGGQEVTMKNNRKAIKGKCVSCGTNVFRII